LSTLQVEAKGLDTIVKRVGVQIDYDVVHIRTSLVQLSVLLQLNFEKIVQIIELRRFGGAPKGYPFAALQKSTTKIHAKKSSQMHECKLLLNKCISPKFFFP
jgi:hypothetical protein